MPNRMKRFFFVVLFVLCLSPAVLKAQDTIKAPSYTELARMYSVLASKVDSARQRAVEDSILIANFIEQSRAAGLASMPAPKKPTFWTTSLLSQLNFTQTSFTNWAAGGNSSFSLAGYVDGKANYAKNKLIFENRLQLGYGFLKTFGDITKKSDDRLILDMKFGYKAADNLYFSVVYGLNTQMSNGFKYTASDTTLVSKFAAPLNTNLALGIEYKPFTWISFNVAPLTGGVVVVVPEMLRTIYGNAVDQMVRWEFGAQIKMNLAKEIAKNVKVTTDLTLFSDYINNPQNIDVKWDFSLNMKVNKWWSANIRTNLIYDDDIKIADADGHKAARLQFKEVLGIGLTYTLSNK